MSYTDAHSWPHSESIAEEGTTIAHIQELGLSVLGLQSVLSLLCQQRVPLGVLSLVRYAQDEGCDYTSPADGETESETDGIFRRICREEDVGSADACALVSV